MNKDIALCSDLRSISQSLILLYDGDDLALESSGEWECECDYMIQDLGKRQRLRHR